MKISKFQHVEIYLNMPATCSTTGSKGCPKQVVVQVRSNGIWA